ncbi:MAG: Mut7-C RNAse domain-containing protein [Bryobacterales bacterium]|nr:Mut7-C RNAse domain-containing protein [Bryobacterales bacterium]
MNATEVKTARFRFYAELNDFLPPERRMREFEYSFSGRQSVKHLIEAAGVPHTEVDLVLANGEPVDFGYLVEGGDRISVYPVFEAFDIAGVTRVRPQPLRQARFVLDGHLGRLAAYLRMLGFDTVHERDSTDDELARCASEQRRILLTRDRELLKRSAVTHGYYVRQTQPRAQLVEVLRRFDLAGAVKPFVRCLRCNELLEEARKEEVWDHLPPRSREHYREFWRCPGCGRVYWGGSHYRRMERLVEQALAAARDPATG